MATDFISSFSGSRQRPVVSEAAAGSPSLNDSLYANIRQTGYMAGNRFLVLLFPNQAVRDAIGMSFVPDGTRLAVNCKSVSLNEKSWFSSEENYITAGATRVFPYKRNTNNSSGVRVSYNCGSDMFEREFFEAWFNYIQNPVTKQWKFYDDYARDSELFVLLLPKNVKNLGQAVEAMYQGKVTGVRLTEVYPFSISINGGTLSHDPSQTPLTADITLMYRDMVPLNEVKLTYENIIPTVTDTGYPVIDSSGSRAALDKAYLNLTRAVNGHTNQVISTRRSFEAEEKKRMSILESYVKELDKYKNDNFPKAVDGRVVYQTPSSGGIDLGLSLLSQAEGFFGL